MNIRIMLFLFWLYPVFVYSAPYNEIEIIPEGEEYSVNRLETTAESGDRVAQLLLGVEYFEGTRGGKPDYDKAR
jgi:hypothetical protein